MATAAELLATKASGTSTVDKTLVIDNYLRAIQIPSSITNLGVENDDDVLRLNFRMPRYLGKTDLSTFSVRINYLNAKGESDVYTVSDLTIVGENLTFSWLVGPTATKYKGATKFNVCMRIVDADAYVQKEYNTTIATLPVLEGLECEESVVEYYSDILEQWRRELFGIGDTEESKLQQKSEEEQENIAQKGIEVLATIPEDYQSTYEMANNAYRTRANAIVSTEQGEIIKLTDSSNDPLRGLRVFGKTTQVTTSGKNLAYTNINVADYLYLGVMCSATNDSNVRLNGIATSDLWNRLASADMVAGETYTLSADKTVALCIWDVTANDSFSVKSAGSDSVTFVAPNTGSYALVLENPTGTRFADVLANIMLSSGDVALPWEPYSSGIASPAPDCSQPLRSIESPSVSIYGKNLVNDVLIGATATQYSNCLLVDMDGIKPNTTYTLSFVAADGHKMYVNENLFSYQYILGDGKRQSITLTTKPIVDSGLESHYTSNHWIILKNSEGNTVQPAFEDVQIELGSSCTDYVEHAPSQSIEISRGLLGIPVTSGGNYTDSNGQQWICDEIDFERGVYIQRIAMKIFDGTETTWRVHATLLTFMVDWPGADGGWELNHAISSHFECGTEAYSNTIGYFAFDSKGLGYFATEHTTLDDFLAWMRENPVTVIAKLATPIETELTAEELVAFGKLHSNYPNTTILNDAGATMEVKYNEDLKMYADEIMEDAANVVITQDKIQAAVDNWLSTHYSTAEGVSF